MKNKLFMLGITGMILAGCSNTNVLNEVSDVQTKKITFDTHINKPTTKADLATDNLSQFWVAGYYTHTASGSGNIQVFNKARVYKQENNWVMSANDERYWIKDAKYEFFAYCDGGSAYSDANFNLNDGCLLINEYEVNPQSHSNDLIFATASATGQETGQNNPVALTFKHLLSKIQFTFENNFSGDYKINITSFTIEGIRSKASYNIADNRNEWTFDEDHGPRAKAVLTVSGDAINGNGDINKQQTATTGLKYVLPRDYAHADVKISFKFDVYPKNENGQWSTISVYGNTLYTSLKPNWDAGNQYNYNVKLAGGSATGLDKIEFTVTKVDEWGNIIDITEGLNFSTTIPEPENKNN